MPSKWDALGLSKLIAEILQAASDEHHFGRPFLTAYQVAIELRHRFPDACSALGYPTGGSNTGRYSLAQYVARQLSKRLKDRSDADLADVEGGLLSSLHLVAHHFRDADGSEIHSSLPDAGFPLSMFRWRTCR